ncbi:MAG: hypothetical protein IMW89_21635 [Ktedonobacteraceae bacterium]|nr:hypothetical protein [Ktedonobacteraceae bacterium]
MPESEKEPVSSPLPETALPAAMSASDAPVKVTGRRRVVVPSLWRWFAALIILGLLTACIASSLAGSWARTIRLDGQPPASLPVTTLPVGRTAPYAGLAMTVVSAQYALSFPDDAIRPGPATVRLNMRVTNQSGDHIKLVYYDCARLLVPSMQPVAPTNVSLSAGPQPGKSESGWLDFAVPRDLRLDTLTLQLGNVTLNESPVKIPFGGSFDGGGYADQKVVQDLLFPYTFRGFVLNYHLTGVEVRYAYHGVQARAGQRYYVLNFVVDNAGGADVGPGRGFDYVRLVVNGYAQPPIDSSLPETFKAGASGVKGSVVFSAPAGMKNLTVGFLYQLAPGMRTFEVKL